MVYTHLINFEEDSYTNRMTRTAKSARALIEAGFEYVYNPPDGLKLLKKPKYNSKSPRVCVKVQNYAEKVYKLFFNSCYKFR